MAGELDSWAIRRTYAQFRNNAFTVFPRKSLIANIGLDGSGVHCKKGQMSAKVADGFFPRLQSGLQIDPTINKRIRNLNSPNQLGTMLKRITRLVLQKH
jgi:hypothetical protein